MMRAAMIIGLKEKMNNYLHKMHLSFLIYVVITMALLFGFLTIIGKVLVILFLLGTLIEIIRQHPWIWRLDLTTPNDTETASRLFFFYAK